MSWVKLHSQVKCCEECPMIRQGGVAGNSAMKTRGCKPMRKPTHLVLHQGGKDAKGVKK